MNGDSVDIWSYELLPNKGKNYGNSSVKYKDIDFSKLRKETNLALEIPKNVVCCDFDEQASAECFLNICQASGLKFGAMRTDRGIHFYFRQRKYDFRIEKQLIGFCNILSLPHIDFKSDLTQGKMTFYRDGKFRDGISSPENFEDTELSDLPIWAIPCKYKQTRPAFPLLGMGEGDGRNEAIFRGQSALTQLSLSIEDAKLILNLINEKVFKSPLIDHEIQSIINRYKKIERSPSVMFDKKTETCGHDKYARYLWEMLYAVKYNDTVYVYNDKYFELTTEILPKKIALLTPEYKSSDLKEVTTRFLQLEMPENITDMTLKERYVAFKDKVIGSNGQMMSHTPTVFASHYIDAVLDLTATHKKTEEFFEELLVKNSDKEQLLNFWEHMGCVIWDKSDWGKSNGILKGPTGSLKSHILFAISNAIGERNCAHIRMTDFATNNDFKMANTIGKLLNSSEEIPRKKISDDVMTVLKEYIGSQLPKTIRPIWGIPINVVCEFKHLYATNVFPGLETTAEDVMIRFCLGNVPNQYPKCGDDGEIDNVLRSKESRNYILRMMYEGGMRFLNNKKKFTESPTMARLMREGKVQGSTVSKGLNDNGYNEIEKIIGKPIYRLYDNYTFETERDRGKPLGMLKFKETICSFFENKLIYNPTTKLFEKADVEEKHFQENSKDVPVVVVPIKPIVEENNAETSADEFIDNIEEPEEEKKEEKKVNLEDLL